jgi:hypothetical protein
MKYFGNWKSHEDVVNDFKGYSDSKAPDGFPTDEEIIYAAYSTPDYEGYALLVYEKDGKLFEVNGSHCSCYGLEECWHPEETSKDAIAMRELSSYYEFEADAIDRFKELFPKKVEG